MTTQDIGSCLDTIERIGAIPQILDVIHRSTGMGCVAVARVTEEKWTACSVLDNMSFGLKPHDELEIGTTLCAVVRRTRERIVIEDVDADPVYAEHCSPRIHGYKSFISVPIVLSDGSVFGTLCAISPQAMSIDDRKTIGLFEQFAALIAFHFDAAIAMEANDAELVAQKAAADAMEEFVAVLGHDLRNPLAAMASGIRLLRTKPDHPKRDTILDQMSLSVSRLDGMVGDVLDTARASLGAGIPVERKADGLDGYAESIVDELRSGHPGLGSGAGPLHRR